MLRFGSAIIAGRRLAVALAGDDPRFIDVSEGCPTIGRLESFDDILDLSDEKLAAVIAWARTASPNIPATEVTLLPPLLRPARMRDAAITTAHFKPASAVMARQAEERFPEKAAEAKERLDAFVNQPFAEKVHWAEREVSALSGDGDAIVCPEGELDFELELAAVVRRKPDGGHSLFGYTLFNDWTIRDLQLEQFVLGKDLHGNAKNFPTSNTVGPMVVLAEDAGDPVSFDLSVEINGRAYASGRLDTSIWSFPDAIEALFSEEVMTGHEIVASGTVLTGCCYENGDVLPHQALVQLRCREIGSLTR